MTLNWRSKYSKFVSMGRGGRVGGGGRGEGEEGKRESRGSMERDWSPSHYGTKLWGTVPRCSSQVWILNYFCYRSLLP